MAKPTPGSKGKAWATIVTNHAYLPGAVVLKSALERLKSAYPLVVLVTPLEGDPKAPRISKEARGLLASIGCEIREVEYLVGGGKAYAGPDARFADTWTKLRAFELFEYERVVLLDSDMLPRRNMDELFDIDLPAGGIAASHACTCNPRRIATYPTDWIPENCGFTYATPAPAGTSERCKPLQPESSSRPTFHSLNSGLVVLEPSSSIFQNITARLETDPDVHTFRFPDQDFLARHFRNRVLFLGYEYNALKSLRLCHKPLWRDEGVRNVHYIFAEKPWTQRPDPKDDYFVLNQWWWDEFGRVEQKCSHLAGWDIIAAGAALKA